MTDSSDVPRWRREAERLLHRAADALDDAIDDGRRRLRRRLDRRRTVHVQPYRGWANERHLWLEARALGGAPPDHPEDDASLWANALDTLRRAASREVEGARVALEVAGLRLEATSDDEGYLRFELALDQPMAGPWQEATLHLLGLTEGALDPGSPARARALVRVPTPSARLAVVSDIDDTVLHTAATDLLAAARLTLFGNAKTRKPLPGVAAFYRALVEGRGGEANPVFYVSSSPWNLYDLLEDFLRINEIPAGPILLQDFGIDDDKLVQDAGHRHKLEHTLRLIETYPRLDFVLVGDSGQEDATLYLQAATEHPERIAAVYIRDVDPGRDSERDEKVDRAIRACAERGVPMVRIADSADAAQHAAALGLIDPAAPAAVAAALARDHDRPG